MSLHLAGVLADAAALWRRERGLLVPLAGMFFLVPMLGMVLLIGASGFPGDVTAEQLPEALRAFQSANLVPILGANLALDFGSFAVMTLFLQTGERTLGEVLIATLRRFLPFLAIDLMGSFLFGLGLSLFLLPGLLIFSRTWLAIPAYAAAPEAGPVAAIREGWRRSGGTVWIAILAGAGMVLFLSLLAMFFVAGITGGIGALLGGGQVAMALGYLAMAVVGAGSWTALTLLRVAFYRAGSPRQGI
ncbi:hypothetical protein AB2M62_13025 [Sphingomonas sp. MMS12-HWE2-04]|uniref:hypothetical protein n=1 Tax=Sphingomonas sp. MMS12-HWE2-04 TaxID=3234199 RepID=UPI00384A64A2